MKSSQVYNPNNDGDDSDMNILLRSNSVTELVYTLMPIMPHQRVPIVILKGCPRWIPVMASLRFTLYTLYYYEVKLKYKLFFSGGSSWAPVYHGSNWQ